MYRLILLTVFTVIFSAAVNGQNSKNLATVDQLQGLYVFTDCKPATEYEYLGTVVNANIGLKSPQYVTIRDALIKELKEKFPTANGVLFQFVPGGKDKADAILLK